MMFQVNVIMKRNKKGKADSAKAFSQKKPWMKEWEVMGETLAFMRVINEIIH